jgi:16S rRNA (adenine1518-N6/adenine1519-N6)-dimethyltransferase
MNDTSYAKKSLGQHWLNDEASLHHIVMSGDIQEGDTIVEIGPGNGALTRLLVDESDQVVAIEFDDTLAATLSQKVPADNLQVIHQDVLTVDFAQFGPKYKIIANIPYYLTSNLVRRITEAAILPERMVILIQKEVAQRIAAQPGDMSLLSLAAQLYFEPELGDIVPKSAFYPAPKVDSQVIVLKKRDQPLVSKEDETALFRLAKMAFVNRRKTLLNSLSAGFHIKKQDFAELFTDTDATLTARPQELSIDDWQTLLLTCRNLKLIAD